MDNNVRKNLFKGFLSTPSGWRATLPELVPAPEYGISIHALRVEGDEGHKMIELDIRISIHALRVEGDRIFLRKV